MISCSLCWGCCLAWLGCQPRALEVAGSNPASPRPFLCLYLAPPHKNTELQADIRQQETCNLSSAYHMFKYSIRCELTRKYYERRLRTFFDFIEFCHDKDIEERCNTFAQKGKINTNWALNHILSFMQFQKERVEKNEIAAATLSNFVKSIKLFCEMSDIPIPWKKITRGLPRPRLAANDRAPTIEEI